MSLIGVVIIGRNEGERLKRSILSIRDQVDSIIYVDSGSTDGSQEYAKDQGISLVELDIDLPFSAARARNIGFSKSMKIFPKLEYVQFVDGDCEVDPDWINHAVKRLEEDTSLAIVCGRRRERYRDTTIYNRLCDIEWDSPIGLADSCGGDFLVKVSTMREVEGFNPMIVAGEEPELCFRIRKTGLQIERLDREMTLHDAAITKFSQWWKRTLRSGHAYAQNMFLHYGEPEKFNQKKVLSIVLWGLLLPCAFLVFVLLGRWVLSLSLVLLYGVLLLKIFSYTYRTRNLKIDDSILYSTFTVLGKVPQVIGVILFFKNTLFAQKHTIIEYKT